jgi:hypothetical protein
LKPLGLDVAKYCISLVFWISSLFRYFASSLILHSIILVTNTTYWKLKHTLFRSHRMVRQWPWSCVQARWQKHLQRWEALCIAAPWRRR